MSLTQDVEALADEVRSRLVAEGLTATPGRVATTIRALGVVVGDSELLPLAAQVHESIAGLGPLTSLLNDPRVTDVVVNDVDDVWVDRGQGLEQVSVRFATAAAIRDLARRLAERAGRRLDDAHPFVDARLPGGVRLHAILPPVAVGSTKISLRVPATRSFSLDDLVAHQSIDDTMSQWLRHLVRARLSFVISGGTGCGKTTVLGALLGLVDPTERIVICEDTNELDPAHPHVVRLEAREANVEGAGAITLRDLVRQSLRMRPDRLVVGETRGVEVVDLLAALNTGHEGGAATTHANSAADVPARLEALALMAGVPRPAIQAQLAAGLQAVIHLERQRGRRVIDSVSVLARASNGDVFTEIALRTTPHGTISGPGLPALRHLMGV